MNVCCNNNMLTLIMIDNNIQKTEFVPKLPHCAQSPDLDGVIDLV